MAVEIDAVGMVVRDIPASLRFYRLLGLPIPEGIEGEPHVEFETPNGYRLMWDTVDLVKSIDPSWSEPKGQRITLGFKCDSPAEVDELYARLLAAGYAGHKEPWDAFWGQRYAMVTDPDGNHVDLFAAL
jgi:uncharacterized glyoxalase superfamily protein PhnB